MPFSVASVLAYVLGIVGTALVLPLAAAIWYGEGARAVAAFAAPLAASWLSAALAFHVRRRREGEVAAPLASGGAFLLVGGVWVAIGFFGALPFWLGGAFPSCTDAVFESVSGFTTTCASVAPDVEALSASVNLWRCETHWLGGKGVIALAFAGLGLVESVTAALSMVGNVGPAFGDLGPTACYAALPDALKWWYAFAMLAGRLEIYTMLVLLVRVISAPSGR